jgi:hypothetical protein
VAGTAAGWRFPGAGSESGEADPRAAVPAAVPAERLGRPAAGAGGAGVLVETAREAERGGDGPAGPAGSDGAQPAGGNAAAPVDVPGVGAAAQVAGGGGRGG